MKWFKILKKKIKLNFTPNETQAIFMLTDTILIFDNFSETLTISYTINIVNFDSKNETYKFRINNIEKRAKKIFNLKKK